MIRKEVKSWEHWLKLKKELTDKGYRMWQWQYDWDNPEGFHAKFYNSRLNIDVEIITYLEAVEDDMFNSEMIE